MSVPKEHEEAVALVDALNSFHLDHWHLGQETWTTSWRQKAKNKSEGVRKGVADYLIKIPAEKSSDGKPKLLFVELKRQKRRLKSGKLGSSPSKVYKEQWYFLELVREVEGVEACVAYGAVGALAFLNKYLRPTN